MLVRRSTTAYVPRRCRGSAVAGRGIPGRSPPSRIHSSSRACSLAVSASSSAAAFSDVDGPAGPGRPAVPALAASSRHHARVPGDRIPSRSFARPPTMPRRHHVLTLSPVDAEPVGPAVERRVFSSSRSNGPGPHRSPGRPFAARQAPRRRGLSRTRHGRRSGPETRNAAIAAPMRRPRGRLPYAGRRTSPRLPGSALRSPQPPTTTDGPSSRIWPSRTLDATHGKIASFHVLPSLELPCLI